MYKPCADKSCFAHKGESCALGETDLAQCASWCATITDDESEEISTPTTTFRVPWSGSALGLADMANLNPRGRTILIGVLGAHDAGKTTLLTGNYLQLLRGQSLANAQFAGSRTLGAWEALAAWTRFDDAARPATFPPHTPRGISRVPGLLHLALRNTKGEFRDVLLTDAPGEWFTRWAIKEDAPEAEGARWVVRNADAFLVFADCNRLAASNQKRGTARNELRQLLERLGNHVGNRPTTLVWAKDDIEPSADIRSSIQQTLARQIPHVIEVSSSTNQPATLTNVMETALCHAWSPVLATYQVEPVLHHQPFSAFRGCHAYA
ncbi:TRAFAC clade GTPase domain-containing protein (plasmid) [Methylomonas sp. MS20]|uniref:TRAFAC clade GTPase domain-containing protein n=1 Tax=Methylomonas sp. MS20 TaxID=3418769 RepID=UPI003CFD9454